MTQIVPAPVGRGSATLSGDERVEILGVAGAGKSTLATRLAAGAGVEMADFIHTRRPSHLLEVVRGIPRLLPTLFVGITRSPRMSWPEWKLLVYVTRWRSFLERRTPSGTVLLFDQGPLYALVRLEAEGKAFTTRPAFERWRDEMLAEWVGELSLVVFLDAPDAVLWERINVRPQGHKAKGEEAKEGLRFIARYRRSFDALLGKVEESGGPQVVRYDTGSTTPERIAERVDAVLRSARGR